MTWCALTWTLVQALCQQPKADPDKKDKKGACPLHAALVTAGEHSGAE